MDIFKIVNSFFCENGIFVNIYHDMPIGYETTYGTYDVTINTLFLNEAILKNTPNTRCYSICFTNCVMQCSNNRAKLRAKLCQIGEENKNAYCLVDFIDLQMYFRICHTITHTMEEDLNFLSKNIDKADLSYNTYIQGLLTSGLVYQSVIGGNCDSKYSFTPLAESVDRFAVSYDNVERYLNPMKINDNYSSPQTQISGIPEWEEISESDIEKIF